MFSRLFKRRKAAALPVPPPTTGRVKGKLVIMDKWQGDAVLEWDTDDEESVKRAKVAFDDQRARGALAYVIPAGQTEGEVVPMFDRYKEEIIIAPRLVGG